MVDSEGNKHYQINGPLFFASTAAFHDLYTPANDPKTIYIDFKESRVVDHSGTEAINRVTERYDKIGKKVFLKNLSADCKNIIKKAGNTMKVNVLAGDIQLPDLKETNSIKAQKKKA